MLISIELALTGFLEPASRRGPLCALFLAASLGLGAQGHAQTLPDDIDISVSPNGVVPLPPEVDPVFTDIFDRYTKLVAPNGQAIHLLIQDQVTDEMAVRAREVMRFYITDVSGTQYGADKTALANSMGDLEACLAYFNTEDDSEDAFNGPFGDADVFAQDLYATESVVEGSADYIDNTNRDATLEEVFHLVHGAGIEPTLPAFHAEITDATKAAIAAGIYVPPDDLPPPDYPFEYIISVIDVYYGYWAHDPDGDGKSFHGEYAFNTRAAIEAGDPQGVAAMRRFLPEFFSAQLHCAARFKGAFTLTFDSGTEYTHKSQYLTDLRLSGVRKSDLTGNPLENVLGGNRRNNVIGGGPGIDTASFAGLRAEYDIQCDASGYAVKDTVPDRDGRDSLSSIEFLRFVDRTIAAVALYADPQDPASGDTLTLGICSGVASKLVGYTLVDIDGTPVFFWLAFANLDSNGEHSIAGTLPPGLSGLSFTFRGFTIDGGGAVVTTNDASITVQ